jgi:hypothetical protein
MLETTYILAGASVISLMLAIAAAISPLGRLQIRQLDGAAATDDRFLQMAAYLLMTAVALSGAAALLTVAAWFD